MTKSSIAQRRHDGASTAPVLISLPEAAELWGVSVKSIRRRIADGSLKGYRLGPRVLRVDQTEVLALIKPIPAA